MLGCFFEEKEDRKASAALFAFEFIVSALS